jgi:hypothetical protein
MRRVEGKVKYYKKGEAGSPKAEGKRLKLKGGMTAEVGKAEGDF